ncbi:MAG: TerB family tellurite resistance protein [Pseudomonadota bacterium]|nr:TerB family tellurite resistance protein [Pseudomonadota bacterium]
MANSILQSIRNFVEGNPSVRRVADDIELTSELILLVRMMFADGELREEEFANFERICETAFAIPRKDVPEVLRFLREFGYETRAANAASIFSELPVARKRSLLIHMLSVAKSDNELHADEAELIRRTATLLGLTPGDITAIRES